MSSHSTQKKTLILHAGMPKTGSTQVQRFLLENAEVFSQRGFLAPLKGVHRADQHRYSWKSAEGVANYTSTLVRVPEVGELWEALGRDSSVTHQNLIISAEGFYWDFHPDLARRNLDKIAQCLPNHSLRVLIYLRDEAELLASIRNEWVKTGFMFNNRYVAEENYGASAHSFYAAFLEAGLCNYADWVDNLAGLIGPENLLVRIYDRRDLVDGDICRDFLDALGQIDEELTSTAGFEFREDDANPREEDPEIYALLAEVGQAARDLPHRSRAALIRRLRHVPSLPANLAEGPTGAQVEKLLQATTARNDRLCSQRFPEREHLFSRPSSLEVWGARNQELAEISTARAAHMLTEIWRAGQEEVATLSRESTQLYAYTLELVELLRKKGVEPPALPADELGQLGETSDMRWQRKTARLALILAELNTHQVALWGYNDLAAAVCDSLHAGQTSVSCIIDRKAGWQNLDDEWRGVPVVTLTAADLRGTGALVLCTEQATASMMDELETHDFEGMVIAWSDL